MSATPHSPDIEASSVPPLALASLAGRLRELAEQAERRGGLDRRAALAALRKAASEAEQQLAAQEARIRHLESLSVTDELTGLLNRRGFDEELSRTLARAGRQNETGLLVLCDLDHFKAINDRHGHPAGDSALKAVARILGRRTRRGDRVARYGGDEFAVLMPACNPQAARRRVARLQVLVNSLVVEHEGARIAVSASFGSAAYDPDSTPETLVFLADRALYRIKQPQLVRLAR